MLRASMRRLRPSLALAVAGLASALASGCGHNIGDPCATNVDCSPLGNRFCDVSSPGGYCTVEGCAKPLVNGVPTDSCPSEAVCIRFFSQIGSEPCTLATAATDCRPDERCLCDCTDPNNATNCLPPIVLTDADGGVSTTCDQSAQGTPTTAVAHCAPEASEHRDCEKKCSSDSDCRTPDYECRATGTNGAEPVPTTFANLTAPDGTVVMVPVGDAARFCVQKAH
jgi:hypothetical protein